MNNNYLKTCLLFLFIGVSSLGFSQNIGINTTGATPSSNAILDLNTGNSNNVGVIIPSVTLGASLATFNPPILGAATAADVGMMVYNSGGTQAVGYYYWNGTTWVSVDGGLSSVTVTSSAASSNVINNTLTAMPGMTESITLPVACNILVDTHGYCSMTSGTAGAWALAYVWIEVDGTPYFLQMVNLCTYSGAHFIGNGSWGGAMAFPLTAGPHTIAVYGSVGSINSTASNAVVFAGPSGFNTESFETVTILHP